MEKQNYFKSNRMKPRNINDNESFKVRNGIVGGYISYLRDNDTKYINQVINDMGCPFARSEESIYKLKDENNHLY